MCRTQVNRLMGKLRTARRNKRDAQVAQLQGAITVAQGARDTEARRVSTALVNDDDPLLQAAIKNCAFLQRQVRKLPDSHRKVVPYAEKSEVYEMMHAKRAELLTAMADVSRQDKEFAQSLAELDLRDQHEISERVADLLGTANEKDERLEDGAYSARLGGTPARCIGCSRSGGVVVGPARQAIATRIQMRPRWKCCAGEERLRVAAEEWQLCVAELHEEHELIYDIGRLTFPQGRQPAKKKRGGGEPTAPAPMPTYRESNRYFVDNTVVLYRVDIKLDSITIPQMTSFLADLFDGHYRAVMMLVRIGDLTC
jgi:hypothetical protein